MAPTFLLSSCGWPHQIRSHTTTSTTFAGDSREREREFGKGEEEETHNGLEKVIVDKVGERRDDFLFHALHLQRGRKRGG